MDTLDKVTATLVAVALFAAWCVWYQASNARVRHCMDHYTACTSAYYGGK